MPISPDTGLYQEPEPSPFPGGIFSSALAIGNNQIGGQLAAQANTTRQLQQHLLDLRGQQGELDLVDQVRKQRDLEDHRKKALELEKLFLAAPDMSTSEKINAARSVGQEKTAEDLGRDQYHEDIANERNDRIKKDYVKEARELVSGQYAAGFKGPEIAERGRSLYSEDQVPSSFWDKVALSGQSPNAQSVIGLRGAQADKAKRPPLVKSPTGTPDPTIKLIKQRDQLISKKATLSRQLDSDPEPQTKALVQQAFKNASEELVGVENEIQKYRGAQDKTPPPEHANTISTTPAPPKFNPIPAPGKENGRTGKVEVPPGSKTYVPVVVKDGMWVAQ